MKIPHFLLLCIFSGLLLNHQLVFSNEEIEVISITSTKAPLAISLTPDSISQVSQEALDIVSPQHINQILDGVPGTWISRGNGQEHLTAIRSPVLTGAGSCGAFFIGIDGLSVRAPGFCNANQLFDINFTQAASIDVLRSPASTLYGSNALHGVINVVSQDAFAAKNQVKFKAGANGLIQLSNSIHNTSDKSAWLNLSNFSKEEGYQAKSGYYQQKITHIYQRKGTVWNNKTLIDYSNLNQETAGFILGFEAYKYKPLKRSNPNPEAYRRAKSLRAYSDFEREIDTGTISIRPFIRYNEMEFLQHFLPWQALEKNSHSSTGIQSNLEYRWMGMSWLSGFDIDLTQATLKETQDGEFSPSIPQGVHYDYSVNASQYSAYTHGTWQHQDWTFRFGARVEHNRYEYDNKALGNSPCAPEVDVCRFSRPDDTSLSFNSVSPFLNLQYTIKDNLFIYTKYAQGYRAPQATELFRLQNNQQVADIDKENIDGIEVGIRYLNNKGSIHLAAFNMDKKEIILQDSNRQNVSGGQTIHKGIEIEFTQRLSEQFSIAGHISYAQHKYANSVPIGGSSVKGKLIDTAPKYLSNLNLNYRPSEDWIGQLSMQYTSDYYLNPENTAKYEGHFLFDANLMHNINDKLSVNFHILNVMNKDYAERADFAFGNYRYFVGQARRAFISVNWKY